MNWIGIGSDNGVSPISASSHYLKQCWLIVNWTFRNKRQWNFSQNRKLFVHENASENIVGEMQPFCSGEDELNAGHFNLISCAISFVMVMCGSIDPESMCLPNFSICTSLGGLNFTISSQRDTVYLTGFSLHLRLASVPKQAFTFKVRSLYSNTGLLMYFYLYLYVLCIDAFMFIWWCQIRGCLTRHANEQKSNLESTLSARHMSVWCHESVWSYVGKIITHWPGCNVPMPYFNLVIMAYPQKDISFHFPSPCVCRYNIIYRQCIIVVQTSVARHSVVVNTLRPRQESRHFSDGKFKSIFLYYTCGLFDWISLKLVLETSVYNTSTLVWIAAWRWTGDKPLSESKIVQFTDAYASHSAPVS